MIKSYLLAIDQSTSATKAVLFDQDSRFAARYGITHQQIYPRPGWVEHDPWEIYSNVLKAIQQVIQSSGINKDLIRCLSVTNQRETVLLWNKSTGMPVYNAVVWQCLRGEPKCNELKAGGFEKLFRKKTGLVIDPYFSASGLHWILHSRPDLMQKARKGELAAGTIDSWLIWKLTRGKIHATDYSNACRTLLFNIHALNWDKELCGLFDIPLNLLPEIMPADEIFGHTTAEGILRKEIPISGVLGDSHAALFGQRCFSKGLSKVTYGTGSSVMMNIGDKALVAPEGLVTSVGYGIKGKIDYVFEGNIHSTGATIQWMVDSLGILNDPAESEKLAGKVKSTEGVYFVPAFAGLGAPYWDNKVRANISGIHSGTRKEHIVRAGLESIAYQVKDLLDLMADKAGIRLSEIRVDGGPTGNHFLMQFQSDLLNAPISVSDIEEASALGAALAGGLGIGIWKNMTALEKIYSCKEKMSPKMSEEKRELLYNGWKKAVDLARGTGK
ncbi:MAG TPA: glycerol kinase GlpK [Bacteroidales bacterium]|nr:glycerol kinase GlpK [Bacteroidales bacterium]